MEESAWAEFWAGGDSEQAVGGKHRDRLAEIWRDFFCALRPPAAVILDIAAGSGAVIHVACKSIAAPDLAPALLIATDFSIDAIAGALSGQKDISGFASDAARLPISDRSVAIAVSQYGIEYAGLDAFAEAARILAPGGRFMSISHYAGGAIDAECAENARLLRAVDQTGVQNAARRALAISFERRKRGAALPVDDALERKLQKAAAAAAQAVREAPRSAAQQTLARFLADLSTLCARRLAYQETDALGWIDGMASSLAAYGRRMESMRDSALDGKATERIESAFAAAGLDDFSAAPLTLDPEKPPAAWIIRARRAP